MKTFIPILVCLCSLVVHAQNSIDISNIEYPKIRTLSVGNPGPKGKEVFVNNLYMEISGVPQLPVMGEFHYARMNPEYWRDALLKMKFSGINIVSTYCLWLLHEEFEGKLSWDRYLNIRKFVELCDELGLKVHLRIGPYCNAEIRNGALPEWLVKNRNLKIRSNDSLYLEYVKQWYTSLYNQVKGLLYKDGGPIIAVQLENEYVKKGENNIRIFSEANSSMIGELEVILTNGERVMLNTNSTWFNSISKKIAEIDNTLKLPEVRFAFDEHQSVYSVNIAYTKNPERETRMYVKYKGDYIKLYQNGKLVGDSFYDGTDWTFGIDRLSENAGTYPLIIKVKGLESIDYPVYFEKSVNLEECVLPKVESIRVTRENRYCIPLYY